MSVSRRGLFGLLAGAAALPLVRRLPAIAAAPNTTFLAEATAMNVDLMAELTAITRKAFVPKLCVQIYQQHPLLTHFMENTDGR